MLEAFSGKNYFVDTPASSDGGVDGIGDGTVCPTGVCTRATVKMVSQMTTRRTVVAGYLG